MDAVDRLVAAEACRDAARRYSRGVDRLDRETMRSAYWPDAIDEHGSYVGNAWEFCDHVVGSHDRWAFTMHAIFNHLVEVDDDDHARGEAYNVSYLRRVDEGLLDVWFGRYLDRYERREGEWRIAHRVCVHEGDMTVDASTPMPIVADTFRQGGFDRPAAGRPIGP